MQDEDIMSAWCGNCGEHTDHRIDPPDSNDEVGGECLECSSYNRVL